MSELYYPELTSTGYFVTRTAEQVAREYTVRALCAQPTYFARGQMAPWSEVRNGVGIERCRSSRLDKDFLPFRLVNFLSISAAIGFRALLRFRRGDIAVVVTNPPLLPYVILFAAFVRGARVVLMVQDVYPEVLVATGMTTPGSMVSRIARLATQVLYRGVERIVCLGRDMAELIGARGPAVRQKIDIITNWGDVDSIRPDDPGGAKYRVASAKFVVQYSGNMGRTHALEPLLDAAQALKDRTDIHFAISGWGAKRATSERRVKADGLTNVTIAGPAPLEDLGAHIAASDLGVIAFVPGMSGISVPSRMYNVMAAGKALLAIADEDSELARVIREEDIGWVVSAKAPSAAIVAAITEAASDPARLKAIGKRARAAAEAKYSEQRVARDFLNLFDAMSRARPS